MIITIIHYTRFIVNNSLTCFGTFILTTIFPQDPNHRKQQVSGGAGTGRRDRDRRGALQG